MKILFLTTLIIAAIFLAACQTGTNTNMRAGNANSSANSMSNMNGHTMPMNGNANMPGDMMMKSDPDAASQPFDLQFIDTMTAHHDSAIGMAKTAVAKGQNAELKTFAQKIINDQTKENEQMKAWREKWFAGKPGATNMEMAGMMSSMPDMKKLETTSGKEFDLAFLDAMTSHHAGAVQMAKEAVSKAERPEIKTLANQIIKAQEGEIEKMKAWKMSWSK